MNGKTGVQNSSTLQTVKPINVSNVLLLQQTCMEIALHHSLQRTFSKAEEEAAPESWGQAWHYQEYVDTSRSLLALAARLWHTPVEHEGFTEHHTGEMTVTEDRLRTTP